MKAFFSIPRAHRTALFIFLLFLFPFDLTASPGLDWKGIYFNPPDRFIFRDCPATGSFQSLNLTAQKIEARIEEVENGQDNILLLTDYHAVFPLPLEQLVPVFLDHENEDRVYPRIKESRDLSPNAGLLDPHFQEVRTSFTFLGIGQKYHYILYRVPHWYGDDSFMLNWALVHSVDGKYYELYGSWYLEEFQREGKRHTYLRNFVRTGLTDPPSIVKTVTGLFATNSVRNFFEAVYDAAVEQNGPS